MSEMNIKSFLLGFFIGGLIFYFISNKVTRDLDAKRYAVKSLKMKKSHDSTLNVYSKQLDSLNNVIDITRAIDDSIALELKKSKAEDEQIYKSIMSGSDSSSYFDVLDSLKVILPDSAGE